MSEDNEVVSVGTETKTETIPDGTSKDNDVNNPSDKGDNTPEGDVNNPSKENPSDSDTLDFDEIIKVPSTKEDRGGKSRREWAKDNKSTKETKEEPKGETEEEMEARITQKVLDKIGNPQGVLDEIKEKENAHNRKDLEGLFRDTLDNKGISIKDFNVKHKKEFTTKRDEFVKAGLDPMKAVTVALEVVTAKYETDEKIVESEKRSNGRQRAKMTPQSTITNKSTTFTPDQLAKMDQGEYNTAMAAVESGEARIV